MHPILGHFENAPIYSYGVFRLLSYLAAAALLLATSKRLGEPLSYSIKSAIAMWVGGLVGARLGFVLVNLSEPWTLGRIFSSGGSLYTAGLLGGLIGLFALSLVERRSVSTTFDLITPSVVGAWAVGNIGCFLAGCCVGAPTMVPWAITFTAESTPVDLRGVPVHPAQLYALVLEVAILGLLFARTRRFPGELFLQSVVALLAMRIGLAVAGVFPVGATTFLQIGMVIVAAVFFFARRRKADRLPDARQPKTAEVGD